MKAGEYMGKDGREYRWENIEGRYHLGREDWKGDCSIAAEDHVAAKAALDALIEAEAKWVTWRSGDGKGGYIWQRCRPDGSEMQYSAFPDSPHCWHDEDNVGTGVTDAYRKGREVAQQEASGMRDAARELVEAVLALHPARNRKGIFTGTACVMSDALWRAIEAAGTLEVQL